MIMDRNGFRNFPKGITSRRFMNGRNHAGEQGHVMVVEFSDDK